MRASERAGERFKSESMAKVIGKKRMNKTLSLSSRIRTSPGGAAKKRLKKC